MLQVLRWSALVFGVFYGFSHQSAIYSSDKKAAAQHEWDRKVKLIDQAKEKYAKKDQKPGKDDGEFVSFCFVFVGRNWCGWGRSGVELHREVEGNVFVEY